MSKKRVLDAAVRNGQHDPEPKRARREYTEQDAAIAKVFENLASDDHSKRQIATVDLLNLLGEASPQTVNRIQTRLLKGLCSNRKSARLGFFVALAEFWRVQLVSKEGNGQAEVRRNLNDFLLDISRCTTPDTSASNQEKRDYALGHLTALKALFHSEALFKGGFVGQDVQSLLDQVFQLTGQMPWLREQAGMILCEALRLAKNSAASQSFAATILSSIVNHNLAKTPEGVAIWLTVTSLFPEAEPPKKAWHHSNPLHKKELSSLATTMKHNTPQEPTSSQKTASGIPQRSAHFAWPIVLSAFFSSSNGVENSSNFELFWKEAIDQSYFASGSSSERKSIGFQIFSKAVSTIPASFIQIIFSPNLMSCLINQSSKSERYLHLTAKSVLDASVARAKQDPAAASAILAALTTGKGSLNFDRLTNTKTVQSILALVDDVAASDAVKVFRTHFEDAASQKLDIAEQTHRTVADILLNMCRSRPIQSREPNDHSPPEWLSDICWFFASSGLVDAEPNSLSDDTRSMMRTRLSSSVTQVMTADPAMAAILEAEMLHALSSKKLIAVKAADKALTETINEAFKQVQHLRASQSATSQTPYVLLLASTLLEALGGSTDALSLLEELKETLTGKDSDAAKERSSALLDIILGLISKRSAFHSKLGEQIFQSLASQLSEDDLDAMLDVLAQKETAAGQQALFEQAQDDVDEETQSDSDERDSEDDDVEVMEEEDASDEEDYEDDNEDGDDELERFNSLLAGVLKTSAPAHPDDDPSAAKRPEENDDTSSESSMDDEQMMALDSQLAAIFRERAAAAGDSGKTKKREQQDAKQNVVAFKNRVLDLLAIYFRTQHANPLALRTIHPLLSLIRSTSHKQLADKTSHTLQRFFDVAKSKGLPEPQEPSKKAKKTAKWIAELHNHVVEIHAEALLFASKTHAATCSRASLFLARILIKTEAGVESGKDEEKVKDKSGEQLEWLVDRYAETHKECLRGGSRLPASFWADWVGFSLSVRKD